MKIHYLNENVYITRKDRFLFIPLQQKKAITFMYFLISGPIISLLSCKTAQALKLHSEVKENSFQNCHVELLKVYCLYQAFVVMSDCVLWWPNLYVVGLTA